MLKCVHIKDIINNRIGAVDWSAKRDTRFKDSIGFDFRGYARTNYFLYDNEDKGIELLGRGSIDIDNENLEVSREAYVSPFLNTETVVIGKAGSSITTAKIDAVELVKSEKFHDLQDCRFYFFHHAYSGLFELSGTYDVPQGWKRASGFSGNYVEVVYSTLIPGDRVLVVDRGALNGVYVVDAGPWTRATDADSAEDLVNARVLISDGVYKGVQLVQTATKINLGTTLIDWKVTSRTEKGSQLETSTEEKNEPGLRLLLVRSPYVYEPEPLGAPAGFKVGYFIDDLAPFSLHWQSFLDEFYSELTEALQKAKLITRYYRLTERDINYLDFQKLTFDEGDYFLLNKIVNYVPGQSTQGELFKL